MGSFLGSLVIEEIGHEQWRLAKEFTYVSASGLVVKVPLAFRTDLASVPEVFRMVVGKIGHWSQPAVVHDLLYRNHRDGLDTHISRLQADRILLEGIRDKAKEYDVPAHKQRHWAIYNAVRIGGLATWETPEERQERINNFDETFLDQ